MAKKQQIPLSVISDDVGKLSEIW